MRYARTARRRRGVDRRRLAGFEPLESRRLLHAADLAAGWLAEGELAENPVADFALVDTNPTSGTYNQAVSPRDYLDQTSAWYFAHST
jgi:hypothetical protein